MEKTLAYSMRFKSPELRAAAEKRAKEKGLSLNEWLNRAVTHAVTSGGKVRVTTTEVREL